MSKLQFPEKLRALNIRLWKLMVLLGFVSVPLLGMVWAICIRDIRQGVNKANWQYLAEPTYATTAGFFVLCIAFFTSKVIKPFESGSRTCEKVLPPRWMDYVFACFPTELRDEHIGNMTAHFDWCLKRRKSVIYAKTMCAIAVIGILVRLIPSRVFTAVIRNFTAPK